MASIITTTPASTTEVDLSTLARRMDRRTAANTVTQHYFPVTPRSLELWPITWRLVNGKAVCETPELCAVAQAKLDVAPTIPSVRRVRSAEDQAQRVALQHAE